MLTPRQVKIVEDLITCQRACDEAEHPTDMLTASNLDLHMLANRHGWPDTVNMRDLMDGLLSMLVIEEDLTFQQDQINSHLIELGAKQVDLPNEFDETDPRSKP